MRYGLGGRRIPSLSASHGRIAVVLVVLVALAVPISSAAAAGTFTASDVTVVKNNGKLADLTVAPSGSVSYWGLEQPPTATTLEVQVLVDGTWETITTQSVSVSALAGSFNYGFARVSVIDQTSGGMVASDFDAVSRTQPTTTTVDIRVVATFAGAGDGGQDINAMSSTSFNVTVEKSKPALKFKKLKGFDADPAKNEFTVKSVTVQDTDGDADLDRVEYAVRDSSGNVVATTTDNATDTSRYDVKNFLISDTATIQDGETYSLTVTAYDADGNQATETAQVTASTGNGNGNN